MREVMAIMEKRVKPKGICVACINDIHCAFPRNRKAGVVECDEFNPEHPTSSRPASRGAKARGGSRLQAAPDNAPLVKGLCVNCEIFGACKFPKPVAGVWHCEEYQ